MTAGQTRRAARNAEIARLYLNGASTRELASKYDLRQAYITMLLHAAGITIDRYRLSAEGRAERVGRGDATRDRNASIKADRANGVTLRAIARKHGVSPQRILQITKVTQ